MTAVGGFLNVLKPPGISSHDVVGEVRRIFQTKKVGHAGTLDPGAAGVLPVAVGRATRLIEYLEHERKAYRAELQLGVSTDTGDLGGKLRKREPVTFPTADQIEQTLAQFRGKITQVPPAHSAVKIGGVRAYALARSGAAVEIPSREVTIYALTLQRADAARHTLLLDVACSRGTYIRSLCVDIGRALGVPAVMSFLVRTRVGDFALTDAYTIEELRTAGEQALLAPETMLLGLPRYDLPAGRERAFCNGLSTHDVRLATYTAAYLQVYGGGQFLGIGRLEGENVIPAKVMIS